ncbi:MAG: MotA/TolQ/ExbB proton channel family protein [Myxococcales bacterium]|nr:MotA/TolQ/ExbB proton channel family protein [Myxococcales bacterium]
MRLLPIVLLSLAALPAAAEPIDAAEAARRLADAYKKEFAFLDAEKTALRGRLGEVERAAADEERKTQARLEALQRELVAVTLEADALADSMTALEREAELSGDREAVDGLVEQMARAFGNQHVAWPPAALAPGDSPTAEQQAALLADGFGRLGALLADASAVRRAPGDFFLADGSRVAGTLIRVGGVAVYGASQDAAGALTPAGGGRFKLDPPQGEATARALAAAETPASMGIFLFESADQNYELRKEKTPREVVEAGGAIAWVIVALGAVCALLVLLRAVLLMLARSPLTSLLGRAEPLVRAGRHGEVAELCGKARGAGARVLGALARHLDDSRDDLERVFAEGMLREEGRLDRFGGAVLVIAAVAPLLGLLGTVTGMISTFDVITEFGTGNPKLLSGGISEALITTELGLIVAIPALLLGNLLNGRAAAMKSEVEQGALRLINLARLRPEQKPAPAPRGVGAPVAVAT